MVWPYCNSLEDPALKSINPSEFLQYFKFNGESKRAVPYYDPNGIHFHYPIESMLKLIPFQRLGKIRWNSVLEERLRNNINDCAEKLEFLPNGNGFVVPDRRSIGRFFQDYMGVKGHQALFDSLVVRLKEILDSKGITYGEKVGLDSTSLPTLDKDIIGEINGHYYEKKGILKMIKVHTLVCLDTGIPIAMELSGGLDYDGYYLIPILDKAKSLGFNIQEIYGDGHYNTIMNWAFASMDYDAKCYFNISESNKWRKDGTKTNIQREYQKFHNYEDWEPTKDLNKMMKYLVDHDRHVIVGGYLRNEYWRLKKYDFEEYIRIKGKRDQCETLHSILKDQLNFESHLAGKGWDKVMIYTLQFLITLLIVAIIRAENGVDKGFMKISDGVFS